MESGKKEYTFFWFIENYSCCWQQNGEKLTSPPFHADGVEGTVWELWLYPRGDEEEEKGHVSLYLYRSAADDGPQTASITYKLAVLGADESILRSVQYDAVFKKGRSWGCGKILEMDEIFLGRKADYLPHDILTVRCKIRKGEGKFVHNVGQSSARTRITVEKISFLHVVQNFSRLERKQKKTVEVRGHSKGEYFITSNLYFTDSSCGEEEIVIEILPSDADQILRKCDLYLLNGSGNLIECGKADNRNDIEIKSIAVLPLSLTRGALLNRKNEYLPDDTLSLRCKCTFSRGLEFQTIEEAVHGIPLTVKQKTNDVLRKKRLQSCGKNFYFSQCSRRYKSPLHQQIPHRCATENENKIISGTQDCPLRKIPGLRANADHRHERERY
ncbi:unnamed protein product [Larinioides sclopetarius]|uniref:MATH domain-containing protein n=1 Tax=Larinioides sclopetarius TaxID=280406 RepID=A0AAV2BZU6_9ARAC